IFCLVAGTEEAVGAAEQAWPVVAPGPAPAGFESFNRLLVPLKLRHKQLEEALHAGRLPFAGEDERLLGRDREGVVIGMKIDVAGGRHRPEPFPQVFGVEAGLCGELVERKPTGTVQCGEHAGLVAEIGHVEAKSASDVADHFADKVVEAGLVKVVVQGSSSWSKDEATRVSSVYHS